jgi:L-histidine Nalpha-methyltransferase
MSVLARTAASARLQQSEFARDVLVGLGAQPKTLPAKYFYDDHGSSLFEQITRLPEYYPTRTEVGILEARAGEIAALVPPGAALIELGSGSTAKARILLRRRAFAAYVPVDISAGFLKREAEQLKRDLPWLHIVPVAADFTKPFELPAAVRARARVGFFPGSTIGNFDPDAAAQFLRHAARLLGSGAHLVVGVDLVKDRSVLDAAYNDAAGVTAAFNLNLLRRMNRELGADFDLERFRHRAFYNSQAHRIEMHLESRATQQVHLRGHTVAFGRGETIHTESSYKYTIASFQALAESAGWCPVEVWTDAQKYFSVHALRALSP